MNGTQIPATLGGSCVIAEIDCHRSPDTTDCTVHAVTLNADWSIETPHDLAAEEIAEALGGYCDCLELRRRAIPAAQEWLDLHLRRTRARVRYDPDEGWVVIDEVHDCCWGMGYWFRDAAAAVEHATSPSHVAAKHGAWFHHARPLIEALRVHWAPELESRWRSPELGELTRDPAAGRALWEAGIPPAVALDMLAHIPAVTGVVPLSYFLGIAHLESYPGRDRELARQTSAQEALWLVWSPASPAPRRPVAFGELLAATHGSAQQALRLMDVGYTAADLDELARAIGGTTSTSSRLLLTWVAVGCLPRGDDLRHVTGPAPEAATLDALVANERIRRSGISRTQVGLLVSSASPWALIDAVEDGVRTPHDLTTWQRRRRDHW
ncbi:MAG: hypothetical protein QM572_08795 [Nocardioides sp.]|uniref:hypothetical protein n=1 Tax=Nocardioides sp. TaxID=35761 RepID=UPI0039E24F33